MTGTSDRRFTTTDLENLTEGTTPGPWEIGEYGIGPLYGDIYGGVVSENDKDEELAAAAPDLATELHRIRYALEERVRIWEKVAGKLEERGDTDVAEVMLYVARSADRILNGDTNE